MVFSPIRMSDRPPLCGSRYPPLRQSIRKCDISELDSSAFDWSEVDHRLQRHPVLAPCPSLISQFRHHACSARHQNPCRLPQPLIQCAGHGEAAQLAAVDGKALRKQMVAACALWRSINRRTKTAENRRIVSKRQGKSLSLRRWIDEEYKTWKLWRPFHRRPSLGRDLARAVDCVDSHALFRLCSTATLGPVGIGSASNQVPVLPFFLFVSHFSAPSRLSVTRGVQDQLDWDFSSGVARRLDSGIAFVLEMRKRKEEGNMLFIRCAAVVTLIAAALPGQNSSGPQTQEQTRLQQQTSLTPEQMQRVLQMLGDRPGQDPAANAQLLKALVEAQFGATPTPAALASAAPIFAVRQGGQEVSLSSHTREEAFIKGATNDLAELLKSQVTTQAVSIGLAAAAQKAAGAIPYIGGMAGLAGGMLRRSGTKVQGFEIAFLRGSSAVATLKSAPIEFVLPAASALPGCDGSACEPLLLRLKLVEKDKVRVLASRKVRIRPKGASIFGGPAQESLEREVLSSEYESIPVEVQKHPDLTSTVLVSQPLAPGEYALVFQKPEPKSFRLLDTVIDFKVVN
jgi:hypothetical protein